MEEIISLQDYLTCYVCFETFKEPVSLGCNHNFCRSCLESYWEKNKTRNCPLCKRRSSKGIVVNFALRVLCNSFSERLDVSEKPQKEDCERAGASGEAEKQKQFQTKLQSLKSERLSYEELEKTYEDMVQFSKKQAVQCERRIRAEFSRLQRLLQEEEHKALSALREEELRQNKNMALELQEVREKLISLDDSIQELERLLKTDSYSPQPQIPPPRLQPKAGLLLDQAKVLGNLGFRVWSNMRSILSYSPVILNPNTAHRGLCLSEDLRTVRCRDTELNVPDNPDRFSKYAEVLGSEGFSSGSHQWDVEVGDHPDWSIGVTKESVDRSGERGCSPKDGVWCLSHGSGEYFNGRGRTVPVQTRVQRLRVKLDIDLGEVSFYDADHMTHLHTYTDTFTEKLFPFFRVKEHNDDDNTELRILPCDATKEDTLGKKSFGNKLLLVYNAVKDLFVF